MPVDGLSRHPVDPAPAEDDGDDDPHELIHALADIPISRIKAGGADEFVTAKREYLAAIRETVRRERRTRNRGCQRPRCNTLVYDLDSSSVFAAFERGFHPLPLTRGLQEAGIVATEAAQVATASLQVAGAKRDTGLNGPFHTAPPKRLGPLERAAQRGDDGRANTSKRARRASPTTASRSAAPTPAPPPPIVSEESPTPRTAAVPRATDPLPPPVTARDIRTAQQTDVETRRMIDILGGTAPTLESIPEEENRKREASFRVNVQQYFKLDHAKILYHRLPATENRSERLRFYIPYSLRDALIRSKHGIRVAGQSSRSAAGPPDFSPHPGVSKLVREISSRYFWPGLYHDIRVFIRGCEVCQGAKRARLVRPPPHVIITDGPNEVLMLDEVFLSYGQKGTRDAVTLANRGGASSLGQQALGAPRILTGIDHFSGFLFTTKPKKKAHDHQDVLRFLREIFCFCGFFRKIVVDGGSAFIAAPLAQALARLGIKHSIATAYHPQTKGALERAHLTLVENLRVLMLQLNKGPEAIAELLPWATYKHRVSMNSSTKFTPFTLFFGRPPLLPQDLRSGEPHPDAVVDPARVIEGTLTGRHVPAPTDTNFLRIATLERLQEPAFGWSAPTTWYLTGQVNINGPATRLCTAHELRGYLERARARAALYKDAVVSRRRKLERQWRRKRDRLQEFKIGDLVMMHHPAALLNNKLTNGLRGPYIILKRRGPVNYWVSPVEGGKPADKKTLTHVSFLLPYSTPPAYEKAAASSSTTN